MALIRELERLEAGETDRLLLLLPPGSAKSTYATLLFPAWWMARHPDGLVITACHTARLGAYFGRGVRDLLKEYGARLNLTLRGDAKAACQFMTEEGGEYFAIGIHGAVTGRRADLVIIDDPIKSFADAESLRQRDGLWDWYRTELLTRLKPRGRIVVVMTRWHRDDLAGRLLRQGNWTLVQLPALAECDDPLGRKTGDALWPQWETREDLLAKQDTLGERGFAALFQQAPWPDGGRLFDVTKFRIEDELPAGLTVRAWDLASGTNAARDPDWTVGVKMLLDRSGRFWVDDVRRVRAGPDDVSAIIRATAEQDGMNVTVGLPQDPGQAGSYQISALTRLLAGFRVRHSAEKGSKALRAGAVATQVNAGHVTMRRAAWNTPFLDEVGAFPDGRKDDQVDALSRAFNMLTQHAEPARFSAIAFFDR